MARITVSWHNLVVAVAIACLDGSPAFAQPARPLAVVLTVRGDAQVKPSGKPWQGAQAGIALAPGDQVKTGADGEAELRFDEQLFNVIRVEPQTKLYLQKAMPIRLYVPQGNVSLLIDDWDDQSRFEVRTPTAVTGVRGTGWSISASTARSAVSIFRGVVWVHGLTRGDQPLEYTEIQGGYKTTVPALQGPGRLVPLTPEELAAWDAWAKTVIQRRPPGAMPRHRGPRTGSHGGLSQDAMKLFRFMMKAAQQQPRHKDQEQHPSEHHDSPGD